jgi:hypothetical protein
MMKYQPYKTQTTPICPVAIKLGQIEVHAPRHSMWGVFTCECGEIFAVGPHRIYATRASEQTVVKQLEAILTAEHKRNLPHKNSYEIKES